MLHKNKDEFLSLIKSKHERTGFSEQLLEKDYYLSLMLSEIKSIDKNLVFKGGTCLNKIYFSHFRLSEDLDFTLIINDNISEHRVRKQKVLPIKEKLSKCASKFDLKYYNMDVRNAYKHIEYYLSYDSAVTGGKGSIKFEVSVRNNPLLPTVEKDVKHVFEDPFNNRPLFNSGKVTCLDLKEVVAEKLRAAVTRDDIAPRDIYDIAWLHKHDFNIADYKIIHMFEIKCREAYCERGGNKKEFVFNIKEYKNNLGREPISLEMMKKRSSKELGDVIDPAEKSTYSIEDDLKIVNKVFSEINRVYCAVKAKNVRKRNIENNENQKENKY